VWLTVDVYRNRITNRVGLPVVATPNVFFDRASLEAYLTPFIGAANAQAAAAGISGFSGDPANPGVPIGTISPGQIQTADLLIVDLQQNQAETRWGADIGITASVTPEFELRAGYAWVMVEEDDPEIDVNLPHHKGFLGATYRVPGTGLSLGARGRYVDGFDMQQGVLGRDRIDSYAVFDVNAAYQFPNSPFRLVLDAYNILDNEHQEIIASPKLGRLVITRIEARL
jgi:outer membrane receptor protein involved in Fe transport